jgi:hypothetical protein
MYQDPSTPASPVTGEPEQTSAERPSQPRNKKTRPKKTLPTDRIAFPKQLDILRAHAVLSNEGEKPATNMAVGDMVGMTHSTVSLANPFLADIGLLLKNNGGYLPSREAIEFSRANEWGDEQAGHKLAPRIRDAWFGKAILRSLSFSSTMEEDTALRQLAQEASATPEYRSQVALLLSYMETAGLIERDGSQVRKLDSGRPQAPSAPTETPAPVPQTPERTSRPQGASGGPEGGIQFQVSVNVDMAEMAGWDPERISKFFSGMAQVLAAKGEVEENSPEA